MRALPRLAFTTFPDSFHRSCFGGALRTWRGVVVLIGGGFLVGFGTAWAGGCTSGHAISGLANFQLPSLVAVLGFFAGGLVGTWLLLPWLLS